MKAISKSFLPFLIIIVFFSGCATGISTEEAASLYYNLGNAYGELGKDSDAVKAYESARRLDPSLFQAGYNLARLHIDAGRYREGRALLETLKAEDPENVILLEAEAWSYYREGNTNTSIEIYDRILELQYLHSRALYNLYSLYLEQDDLENAGEYIKLLWENEFTESGIPKKNELLLEWCRLQIGLENSDEAMDSLLYLESEEPSTEIFSLLGDIYSGQEKYGRALEYYEKAIDMEEESLPEILFKKGKILLTIAEDEVPGLKALEDAIRSGFSNIDELRLLVETEDFLFVDKVNEIYAANEIKLDETDTELDVNTENE